MRISTKVVIDMATGEVLERESFEYSGPVAMCGGGPSAEQKRAARAQEGLSAEQLGIARQRNAREAEQYAAIKPYAMERLQGGLPFANLLFDSASGTNARAFAPARGALVRRLSSFNGLPSGFAEQSMRDLDVAQARSYDDSLVRNLMLNEQAKSEAARLLTGQQQIAAPLDWFNASGNSNNSILQAQSLVKPGLAGLIGAGLGAAATAYAGR